MPRESAKESRMYEYFPKCPLCKSDMGYDFSGWIRTFARCRHCGAKWLLDTYNMKLAETSLDGKGYQLLNEAKSYSYWQTLKIENAEVQVSGGKAAEGSSLRTVVLLIFVLNFIIGSIAFLYFLANIPWEIMNSSTTFLMISYVYQILLGVSFLAVVYWVAIDEENIRRLNDQIRNLMLKMNTEKIDQ